jgi:hypothetical protein
VYLIAVNVALNKPASQSSHYWRAGNASLAVNGIMGTTFSGPGYTNDQYQWNCIHTKTEGEFGDWWQVDLGQEYLIREVVIYRRGTGLSF